MTKSAALALAALCVLVTGCSSAPPKPTHDQEVQDPAEQQVEDCLTSATMSIPWGECNVQKTVYDALPKMAHCLNGKKKFNNAGELQAEIAISKSGKVKSAKAASNTIKNKKITACLLGEVKKLKFAAPPHGKKPNVLVPLSVRDIMASQPSSVLYK